MGREAKEGEMILRKLFKHNMKEKKNNKNGMGGKEEGKLFKKYGRRWKNVFLMILIWLFIEKLMKKKKNGKEYA